MWILVGAVFVLFIVMFVVGLKQSRELLGKIKDRWQAYAVKRGGRFDRGLDGSAPTLPIIGLVQEGVPVSLTMHLERVGRMRKLWTSARARRRGAGASALQWTEKARQLQMRLGRSEIKSDADVVIVRWPGYETKEEALDTAIALVVELARQGQATGSAAA